MKFLKNILITGENSYIGTNLINWIKVNSEYKIHAISVRENGWKTVDFSCYDVIVHVAGIAHVSANPKMKSEYYKINTDLAIEIAEKAKKECVNQFIFMSSMIIYGEDGKIGQEKIITRETTPKPVDFYGNSKLMADMGIQNLATDDFKVLIVRTPMVYGPRSKGNFPKLIKIAKKTPVFPAINNYRSMIYIDNLTEFIFRSIEFNLSGIYFPQNSKYVMTKDIIKIVATNQNKKIFFISLFNPLLIVASRKINIINKVFGNKTYELDGNIPFKYNVVEFEESVMRSITL